MPRVATKFVVLLPNTNLALAEAFAIVLFDRIRATTFAIGEERVTIKISGGVAVAMATSDAEARREAANAAKREAKIGGKDRFVVQRG